MFGTFFDGRLTADGNVKPDKTDKVSKGIETGHFDTSLSSETEQQLRKNGRNEL